MFTFTYVIVYTRVVTFVHICKRVCVSDQDEKKEGDHDHSDERD